MKFKPYEEYKKVDLPWIDKIPSHWEINRIKDSINYNTNGYWGEEQEGNKYDYICIRVADFDMKNYSVTKNKKLTKRNIRLDNNDRRFLEKGDLLIEKSGGGEKQPVGRVIQYNMKEKAVCSNFISKINIDKKNINSKYILFLLNNIWDTRHIMPYIKQTTGIQNLDDKSFFSNYIQIPPKEEQDKIADFLDYNLGKIDKFVELTERQIALLKEQKEVIINDAVTKGIDKNVEYKDSGIDWIGEIPAHWEVTRVKYISKILNGGTPNSSISEFWNGDIFWVTPKDLSKVSKYIYSSDRKITKEGYKNCSTSLIPKNNIIMATRAPIGNIKINKIETTINQGCKAILVDKNLIDLNYLYFLLNDYLEELQLLGNGATFVELSTSNLSQFKINIPPKKEQKEIVSYIEKETSKIDRTIELYKSQIELIKEYRTSLIASAVTGKIDVRDF